MAETFLVLTKSAGFPKLSDVKQSILLTKLTVRTTKGEPVL